MADVFKAQVLARTDKNESDITSHDERIAALEVAIQVDEKMKEFAGDKFWDKVAVAVDKSNDVKREIEKIIWSTINTKFWIGLIAIGGLILNDLFLRAIPNILKKLAGQ